MSIFSIIIHCTVAFENIQNKVHFVRKLVFYMIEESKILFNPAF